MHTCPNHEHWDKVSWESGSPSGVSTWNVVNKSLTTWLGVLVVWIWSDHRLPGEPTDTGVSASRPENCTRRFRALTLSRMPSLFEEHGVSHGPKTRDLVFPIHAAEPRLLAMLLQGDELFHGQIGEACLLQRPDIICIHLIVLQGDELLHGQIGEACLS